MKKASVTATFTMRHAWDERDTAQTGMAPLEGVHVFLAEEGLGIAFEALASRFGMSLSQWEVKVYEQEETT